MNERPNILILHADQLRYDGLGCDGNPHARTPHIDAIALKRAGRWQNTIVVVTSDHGDFLGDHALLFKALVGSDALLRVPFVLRAPGAGLPTRVGRVMSNCDVLPTLAGLAGVAAPVGLHGCDIRPLLAPSATHRALAQCASGKPAERNLTIYDDRFRLTWWPACGTVELFDHHGDPDEVCDLGGSGHLDEARLLAELKERQLRIDNPMLGKVGAW